MNWWPQKRVACGVFSYGAINFPQPNQNEKTKESEFIHLVGILLLLLLLSMLIGAVTFHPDHALYLSALVSYLRFGSPLCSSGGVKLIPCCCCCFLLGRLDATVERD